MAQEMLNEGKKEMLENSAIGALIAHEAMNRTDPERICKELPEPAAAIVRAKIQQAPDRIQENISHAISRNLASTENAQ